ncbi:MAG: glycosyltransferase family 39 protein [Blastocatellia bacterium]
MTTKRDRNGASGIREAARRVNPMAALVLVLLGVAGLYVALLSPANFGYYSDDAVYVTTAKALATGQGYRLISLPTQPVQTKYPPVYPLMLALIWKVSPNFPDNLTPMLLLSVAASIVASALTWVYLSGKGYTSKWVALLVVALAAINLNTVQFAINTFPEMPYAALSVGALLLAEERERNKDSWAGGLTGGIVLGLLIGLAFLTRVSGITLLAAVALYFVLRKRTKDALIPVAIGGLFVVGWFAWASHSRTPYPETNSAYYTDYFRYTLNVFKALQATEGHSLISVAWSVTTQNAIFLLIFCAPLQALGLTHEWLSGLGTQIHGAILAVFYAAGALSIALGIRRHLAQGWRLVPIYVSFYLILHALLPYPNPAFFSRYLVPILPFLVFFLVTEMYRAGEAAWRLLASPRQIMRLGGALLGLALVTIAVLGFANHIIAIGWMLNNQKAQQSLGKAQTSPSIDWINSNTAETDVIACTNDGMYYLYTGRKAAVCFSLERALQTPANQEEVDRANEGLIRILQENKAKYLALTAGDAEFHSGGVDYSQVLKELGAARVLTPVFLSRDGQSAVYRISLGDQRAPAPARTGGPQK